MTRRIVIVGGGITGLAAARVLGAHPGLDVKLFEGAPRLGGNIRTERVGDFTLDAGPDSWVVTKPQASALARATGIESELIPTVEATRRVYIAWKGGLHPMPEGLVLGVPTQIWPMVETPLFSWGAKVRMGLEPFVPKRTYVGDEDESIGDFVSRRLGPEMTERLAAPLLGGIFAGDADELSIRATFPQFVDAEQRHGSLIRAMRAQRAAARARAQARGGPAPSAFVTPRSGMSALVDAAARHAGATTILTSARVTAVDALASGDVRGRYRIAIDGDEIFADDVVLTSPLHATAGLTRALDAGLAAALDAFTFTSSATCFLAYERRSIAHPLDAVGFLVPRPVRRRVLAGTFVSSKWEHRAPQGHALLRVFFGGAHDQAALDESDDALVGFAKDELRLLLGIDADPLFTRVFRYVRASPQPKVGHLPRVRAVREALARWPGLYVAGNGFDGTGIPDCIRQGEAIAAAIVDASAAAA